MAQNTNISLSLANKIDILNKTQSLDARYGVYDTEALALAEMLNYGADGRLVAVYTDKPNGKTQVFKYNEALHQLDPIDDGAQSAIGDGELDIQFNGTSLQKFKANQVSDVIANIQAQEPLVSGVNLKTVDGQTLLGSGDIPIPPGLTLGETSSTAYRGDRGKIAYDLSQEIDTTMDFTFGLVDYFIVDYAGLKINSVQNIRNTPTVTLTIAGTPYVLGTPLSLGTKLDVSVDTASVIKLKGTR